jgi:hypothetical protein
LPELTLDGVLGGAERLVGRPALAEEASSDARTPLEIPPA